MHTTSKVMNVFEIYEATSLIDVVETHSNRTGKKYKHPRKILKKGENVQVRLDGCTGNIKIGFGNPIFSVIKENVIEGVDFLFKNP